ncbi:hypothetical protein D3C85_695480 [compost metagenome]
MPRQQQPTEQQALPVAAAQRLPAPHGGEAGKGTQGQDRERGTTEHNDGGGGAGEFAEHAGQAEEQRTDMQCTEGGAVIHYNPCRGN